MFAVRVRVPKVATWLLCATLLLWTVALVTIFTVSPAVATSVPSDNGSGTLTSESETVGETGNESSEYAPTTELFERPQDVPDVLPPDTETLTIEDPVYIDADSTHDSEGVVDPDSQEPDPTESHSPEVNLTDEGDADKGDSHTGIDTETEAGPGADVDSDSGTNSNEPTLEVLDAPSSDADLNPETPQVESENKVSEDEEQATPKEASPEPNSVVKPTATGDPQPKHVTEPKPFVGTVASLCTVAALTGCDTTEPDNSVDSVRELRSAYIAGGGTCDRWQMQHEQGNWTEIGTCDVTGATLSTYASTDDRDRMIDQLKNGQSLHSKVFVGPNWIITTDDASAFGGPAPVSS